MRIEDIDKEFQEINRSLKDAERYFGQGSYNEAEVLYKRALELVEKCYGKEHPETTSCLISLAETYYHQHKYSELVPVYTRLWIQKEKELGTSNPEVASLLFKLAKTYEKLGMNREAEYSYRKALDTDQLELKHSLLAASILESYSKLLRHVTGRFDEAKVLDERSRDLRNKQSSDVRENILKQFTSSNTLETFKPPPETLPKPSENVDINELNNIPEPAIARQQSTGQFSAARNYQLEDTSERKLSTRQKVILAIVIPGFMLFVFAGIILALNTEQGRNLLGISNKAKNIKPVSDDTVVVVPQQVNITYRTTDGFEQISILPDGKAVAIIDGARIKGTCVTDKNAFTFTYQNGKKKFTLSKLDYALSNNKGKVFYLPDSPELKLVEIMRKYALFIQAYYMQHGRYPANYTEYINPFTGKPESPRKIETLPIQPLAMTLTEFSAREDSMNKLSMYDFNVNEPAGSIDIYHFPASSEGDAIYIRGTDRTGALLRSSQPQLTFLIHINQGNIR